MQGFPVELFPASKEIALLGHAFHISTTVFTAWGILAAILTLALLFRYVVVPRFQENPRGLQRALEAAVEGLDNYVGGKLHGM
ncbi:MAG: hypothetical protein LBB75_02200, partial [Oscillospiraceae bacterium]|nr:hypothetical protein [Oscillospiraceae bacterium]